MNITCPVCGSAFDRADASAICPKSGGAPADAATLRLTSRPGSDPTLLAPSGGRARGAAGGGVWTLYPELATLRMDPRWEPLVRKYGPK